MPEAPAYKKLGKYSFCDLQAGGLSLKILKILQKNPSPHKHIEELE
jgi:hypothetical protein